MMHGHDSGCKVLMYHYIRDGDGGLPNLKYLHSDDFEKQLDFLEQTYGFIEKATREQFVAGALEYQPQGVVLTFDDGLKDHYRYVLPILKRRNLWGIFFISSNIVKDLRLLNVHKIHYLLGKYSSEDVFRNLIRLLGAHPGINIQQIEAYDAQQMDAFSIGVKKLNYIENIDVQTSILDELCAVYGMEQAQVASNMYMNLAEISEIMQGGNIVGGHSSSHYLLSKLDEAALLQEILTSNSDISNHIEVVLEYFCYPFGGPTSYDQRVIDILLKSTIKYAFKVESRDLFGCDIVHSPYELPRYDCNEFPFGGCRN